MIKVMFVCLGNICRSPMAEFVLKDIVKKNNIDKKFCIKSSATSNEEIGNDMHYGTKDKLIQKNIPFKSRKAVKFTTKDYEKYDYILCMDNSNVRNVLNIIGEDDKNKISRLLDFSNNPRDIADPWFTGNFENAYNDIVEGCNAFIKYLDNK